MDALGSDIGDVQGGTTAEGIHLGAMAGTVDMVKRGYSGIESRGDVVWVNPLKASPGYAPLAQGMAAALPYVDAFVEGHSLAALERVVEVISQ